MPKSNDKKDSFKPGDAVVDPKGEKPPTPHHVFVKVAKTHPLAYLDYPVWYSSDRLKKVERSK